MDWVQGSDDGFIPFPTDPVSPVTQQDFIVREGSRWLDRSQMMDSKHSLAESSVHQSARISPPARLTTNPMSVALQTDSNAKTDKLEAMKAKLMESRRLNSGSVPPPDNAASSSLTSAQPQLDRDTSVAVADIIRKANLMKNEHVNGSSKLPSTGNATPSNGSNMLKRLGPCEHGHNGHQAGQHTGVQVDKNIAVTVHKDIGNEGNEIHTKSQSPAQINQGKAAGVTAVAPNIHERAENLGKSEAKPVSPPPQIVHHSLTDMDRTEVSMNIPGSSFLKNYFVDLTEWLEVTGYHDMPHRKRRLAMYRERQQLEEMLAKVKRAEAEEDHRAAFVCGPQIFSESRPSTASMQPLPPTQRPRGLGGNDEFNVGTTLPPTVQNDSVGAAGAKRPYSAVADTFVGSPLPRKQVRSAQYNEDVIPGAQSISNETAFRHHPQPPLGPQGLGPRMEEYNRRAGQNSLTWVRPQSEAPSGRKPDLENSFDRGHEPNTRMDSRDDLPGPYDRRSSISTEFRKQTHSAARLSNPLSNRYFLVKSWNHDNVSQSQSDGLWATQTHNTPILAQAYTQCKSSTPPSDVVLIFSVNKSGAFQGYAVMSSPPGTAPVPKWAQKLHWTCGEPFYIEWVTVGHVLFRDCGHIKNPLNKDGVDLSVVVGRDGQEIDPYSGRELLRVIDSLSQKS